MKCKLIIFLICLIFVSCQNESEIIIEKWASGSPKITTSKNDTYYKYYLVNGELELEGTKINNLNEGIWVGYYEGGVIRTKIYFKKGKKCGEELMFDERGILREKYLYDELGVSNEYLTYFEDGNIRSTGKYELNIKTGDWFYYNRKGVEIKIESYNEKGEVEKTIEFDSL